MNDNGIISCIDCGIELSKIVSYEKDWRYYGSDDTRKNSDPNRCHIRKIEDKSIFKDVENFGFSEKVVNTANDMYIKVTDGKIYRGSSRKAIIFGCIFHSIKLNGKMFSCESLRSIFNLEKKIILKGLKHVSLNSPKNDHFINRYITPIELVNEYIIKLCHLSIIVWAQMFLQNCPSVLTWQSSSPNYTHSHCGINNLYLANVRLSLFVYILRQFYS